VLSQTSTFDEFVEPSASVSRMLYAHASMNGTKALVEAAARLRRAREAYVLATVVRVTGSAYRRPGARMIVASQGRVAGSVSGGCFERTIVEKGFWLTREGPAVVTFDAHADDDPGDHADGTSGRWTEDGSRLGLGCEGTVEILLERVEPDQVTEPLACFEQCSRTQRRGGVATVFRSDDPGVPVGLRVHATACGEAWGHGDGSLHVTALRSACLEAMAAGPFARPMTAASPTGSFDALVEGVFPPPRLFVFGDRHDAVPLVHMAATLGWEVIVWAPHARFDLRDRFSEASEFLSGPPRDVAPRIDSSDRPAAVIMTHDYAVDRDCLRTALESRAVYVGVLGPRRRTQRMLDDLALTSGALSSHERLSMGDPRIHAPVGLALGAETPEEIALAIAAEVQSVWAGASARNLRELPGSIHGPPSSETLALERS
jgi:xanthine dehydrogenase accessory factor